MRFLSSQLPKATAIFVVAFLLCACGTLQTKNKGGSATVGPQPVVASASVGQNTPPNVGFSQPSSSDLPSATISQPENPAATSEQNLSSERVTETLFTQDSQRTTETIKPDGGKIIVTETFPAGTVKRENFKQGAVQKIGAAQKDTSTEIVAKLGALKWLQFVGIALLLGAAAMFHPVVRTVVGAGKSMQIAVGALGVACLFGPVIFVGYEKWVLIVGVVALGFWWLTNRLSFKEGAHDTLKTLVPVPNPV